MAATRHPTTPRLDDEPAGPIVTSAVGIAVLAEFEAQIEVISEKVLDDAIAAGVTDGSAAHRPEASMHGLALCWGALQYAKTGRTPDFGWFQQSVQERFQRGISREDSIAVFRVGSRSMHRILCEMAMAHPDPETAIAEITDAVYSLSHRAVLALTETQTDIEAAIANSERRARVDLTHALLAGVAPATATSTQRAALRGAPPNGHYVVVVGSAPVYAAALAAFDQPATSAALEEVGSGYICCVQRNDRFVAIAAVDHTDLDNAKAALEGLADRTGARFGVGPVSDSTAAIPSSYASATVALSHCRRDGTVTRFDAIPLIEHLARTSAETGLVPGPGWRSGLSEDLVLTVRALLENNRVVSAAASALGVHPNTVYSRLRQFEQASGLNPRRFSDLVEIALRLRIDEAG